jgi:hypothetical protein
MSERAKNKSLAAIKLFDGIRHQLSWHICKLTVVLAESMMDEDVSLTSQFIESCVKLIFSTYAARTRIVRNFLETYPDVPFEEAEEDYRPPGLINVNPNINPRGAR